jgi:hypothetical protein
MQFEYPATSVLFSIYGAATVAHGSGFLAVFVAGILAGDARAPYKREIERFHAALASLAEIVAFIALGLTIGLHTLPNRGAWGIGLVLAVLLTLVVRPLLVGLLLLPVRLAWGERLFVLWAGLKGAVPILLGTFLLTAGEPDATRLYGVIVVVVAFSVVVQGSLVPTVADRLRVPMQPIQPEPWSLGVRLRHEPSGLRCYLIAAGAPADGCTIADLAVGEDVWISVVIRDGHLVPVHGSTRLQAGDEVLALTDPEHQNLTPVFAPQPSPPGTGSAQGSRAGPGRSRWTNQVICHRWWDGCWSPEYGMAAQHQLVFLGCAATLAATMTPRRYPSSSTSPSPAAASARVTRSPPICETGNAPEWIGGVRSARLPTPGPVGVGSQVARVAGFLGRRVDVGGQLRRMNPDAGPRDAVCDREPAATRRFARQSASATRTSLGPGQRQWWGGHRRPQRV